MTPPTEALFVSYNIRRAIGRDGAQDPARIARVVREIDPDVLAVQEIDSALAEGSPGHQFERLRDELGLESVVGVTLKRADAAYGNAVFSGLPVRAVRRHDISVPPGEPRGVVDLDLDLAGAPIRLLATHLGLRRRERRRQVARLLALIDEPPARPTVVAADLNDWLPGGRSARRLRRRLGLMAEPRSFPAGWPLLRLDRVLADRRSFRMPRSWAHRSPLARRASDHLPVCARLRLRQDSDEFSATDPRSPAT